MAERETSRSWESYLNSVDLPFRLLLLDLSAEGMLDNFQYKDKLEKFLYGVERVHRARRHGHEITHYRSEIDNMQKYLDDAYKLAIKLVKYVKETPFKDNSAVTADLAEITKTIRVGDREVLVMKEYVDAAKNALEKYKPSASPLPMPVEKKWKKLKAEAEVVAITLIVVLSFGFANLRYTSNAQFYAGYTESQIPSQIPTGSFFLPTDIAGLSFEAVYVFLASAVIAIYILGKLMKRW